jgi:hypothetical protein
VDPLCNQYFSFFIAAPNIPWSFYRDELQWASNEMVRLPQ